MLVSCLAVSSGPQHGEDMEIFLAGLSLDTSGTVRPIRFGWRRSCTATGTCSFDMIGRYWQCPVGMKHGYVSGQSFAPVTIVQSLGFDGTTVGDLLFVFA